MPINAGYEYFDAEKRYLQAQTTEERIVALEEMIRKAPKHKSSENFVAELKTRLKKFKEKQEKARKAGGGKKGIKKEGFQCVLIGLPNSGKSSLLAKITNAKPKTSQYPYTTTHPEIGTMDYEGVKSQIVDMSSIGSDNFDSGLVHTADCLLIVIENLSDIEKINPLLARTTQNKIIILNKADRFSDNEQRKLEATIRSKKIPAILVSTITEQGIKELKGKIFQKMRVIRVYTKEPGKPPAPNPAVLKENSSVRDLGETIRNGFSQKVKESRVTGPSSKFPNQKVGLSHILKDRDVVEFHTF